MAKKHGSGGTQPAEGATGDPSPKSSSRRSFLKAAGIGAAAGLAVGGAAGGVIGGVVGAKQNFDQELDGFAALAQRHAPGFDHVVVLMFENRSFDNLLGWLYKGGEVPPGQHFHGLDQDGPYFNLAPDGTQVEAHVYIGSTDEVMSHPNPDPGEFFPHVNTQLYDSVDPPANAEIWQNGISAPFNAPPAGTKPTMSGFVNDYIINYRDITGGTTPTEEQYRVAMGGFDPRMMPVMSTLAKNFAVYDHWFAAVPSQTFCNRSFFHASTSHGFVTNQEGGGYDKWLNAGPVPTVFNRLEEAGVSWRVYYDEQQFVSFTGMLHAPSIQKYWKSNFRTMAQFEEDAMYGNLPAYSFIEPRMIFNHNDMHPPFGTPRTGSVDGDTTYNSALSDVRAGEALLASVYDAIKHSKAKEGSNAMNTALLVTFDEHGGTYDHIAPPKVTSPTVPPQPAEMGFDFTRLGCRVPAIMISAYTKAGTVINDEMHHGSVINTLSRLHKLKPITLRDDTANPLFNAVNLDRGRQPALWPDVHPQFSPENPEQAPTPIAKFRKRPLSSPAVGLLGLLLAKYSPGTPIPANYGEAFDTLTLHGDGLFGTVDDLKPEVDLDGTDF